MRLCVVRVTHPSTTDIWPTDPYDRPTPSVMHAECNFVQSTEGSTYSSTVLDKFVYKPRTDDEYFEALARGGQKSEVRVDVVNLATHHRPTMRQTITNISQLQLHHQRYSHRPPRPPPRPLPVLRRAPPRPRPPRPAAFRLSCLRSSS